LSRKCDGPLSNFAFKCNLRHYSAVSAGADAAFSILPYDAYRNPLSVAGFTFTVSLTNKQDARRVLGSVTYDTRLSAYLGRYQVGRCRLTPD